MLSNVLRELPFSRNQPLKSVDWILKNKINKLYGVFDEIKKKHEDWTLWFKLGGWAVQHTLIFVCT